LQAAATDDAIVLSLGTQHSFPLDEVFRYLSNKKVRDLLTHALRDAPMFPIRWRWNAARALALPRQRGGRRIPAPLQRMESKIRCRILRKVLKWGEEGQVNADGRSSRRNR
jgi:ATP-dependent Lhr-like helicase